MTSPAHIRSAVSTDQTAILQLAEATGMFQKEEMGELRSMLSAYFDGHLTDHSWLVIENGDIQGAAYFAPEMMTRGTWNLYFIGVQPGQQGKGYGAALLRCVEQLLQASGERILLIETSSLESYELSRQFYVNNGYIEEARIREFYQAGEDKVVFWKKLA